MPVLMARDPLKDRSYFEERLRYNAQTLTEFRAIIADATTEPGHRRRLTHTVFRRELESLIARYSRGDSVQELRDAFAPVVDALADYQRDAGRMTHDFAHFDAYVHALWLVSLGILLEISDTVFRRLVDELNNEGRDALFDRLVSTRLPRPALAQQPMYPEPYEPLVRAIDARGNESRARLIRDFLDRYYDGMGDAYWYDSHRTDEAGFFGYWCFELAAIVKALHIDDTAFADNIYYPRDLVHTSP
jgi:hypothetical protein